MRKIIVSVCIKEDNKLLMVQEAQSIAYKYMKYQNFYGSCKGDV